LKTAKNNNTLYACSTRLAERSIKSKYTDGRNYKPKMPPEAFDSEIHFRLLRSLMMFLLSKGTERNSLFAIELAGNFAGGSKSTLK
jgi:hypothetical protein